MRRTGAIAASVAAMALGGLVAAACGVDMQLEATPERVRALWDPSGGTIPTPTDLLRDAETGRLALPIDADAPQAERDFRAYLNTLDGYALSSTVTMPMSAPVAEQLAGGALEVVDRSTGQALDVDVRFDWASLALHAAPRGDAGLQPGREYVYGLRGYAGGIQGAEGEPVIADAGFYFVRSYEPLADHPHAMPGETLADKHTTAELLAEIQASYAEPGGVFDALARRGIAREELAVAGSFTTTTMPAVWFDPNAGRIPMPNGLLIDQETGLVSLPIGPEDDGETLEIKHALNKYDGFAASAAITVESTHSVAPGSLDHPDALRLFKRASDGTWHQVDDVTLGVLDDGKTAYIDPDLTLEHSSEYAFVAYRDLRSTGDAPHNAQPLGALLRSEATLLDAEGRTTVSSIDDATAATLEPVRQQTEGLLDQIAADDLMAREGVAAAVPFRTVSTVERHLANRSYLYGNDFPTDITDVEVRTPAERGLFLALPLVETVVSGKLPIWDRLDPLTRQFYADGHGETSTTQFVMTIPRGYSKGEPIPTVLFGHGLYTSRELVYLIANKLAEAGFAALAIDLPYHGTRAACVEDTDCANDTDTCNDAGKCVTASGQPSELATVEVPFVDAEYPIGTGFAFVEIGNLIGSRDHFEQALVDLMQALRVLREADWAGKADGWTPDGGDVVYLGMSLGGILGSNLAAIEPTIETFVLNVPGADYLTVIEHSPTLATQFEQALEQRGVVRGTDDYFAFQNSVRWLLDPVDPLNIAHHATVDPVSYVDPQTGQRVEAPRKRVLIQMAKDDSVVPNISTRILAERMQIGISEYEPAISNHGFLFDPTSLEGAAARDEMLDFFEGR